MSPNTCRPQIGHGRRSAEEDEHEFWTKFEGQLHYGARVLAVSPNHHPKQTVARWEKAAPALSDRLRREIPLIGFSRIYLSGGNNHDANLVAAQNLMPLLLSFLLQINTRSRRVNDHKEHFLSFSLSRHNRRHPDNDLFSD